jgi:hypothetical protein
MKLRKGEGCKLIQDHPKRNAGVFGAILDQNQAIVSGSAQQTTAWQHVGLILTEELLVLVELRNRIPYHDQYIQH